MEFEVITPTENRRKKFLSAILPSIIRQLGLDRSNGNVLVTLEKDCPHHGLTVQLGNEKVFFVVLDGKMKLKDLGLTLTHEMVHVRQMAFGMLKTHANGVPVWMGRKYPNEKTKYTDRPWEIDAYSKQEIIFRRALEE